MSDSHSGQSNPPQPQVVWDTIFFLRGLHIFLLNFILFQRCPFKMSIILHFLMSRGYTGHNNTGSMNDFTLTLSHLQPQITYPHLILTLIF